MLMCNTLATLLGSLRAVLWIWSSFMACQRHTEGSQSVRRHVLHVAEVEILEGHLGEVTLHASS